MVEQLNPTKDSPPMPEMAADHSSLNRSLAALRNFAKPREPAVRCEMCSLALAHEHRHLVEVATQHLVCACDACALLFSGEAAEAKYRRVPLRIRFLADFCLSDAQWDTLLIPINMAFFFQSTPRQRAVAMYPSPAGAMESLLELESWNEIVAQNKVLQTMEPDVDALLVNRLGGGRPHEIPTGNREMNYFLVPIDECYKLVGVIRANWRGLSGGKEVWEQIDRFFVELKSRAQNR
jgi:hypothetical protein